MKQSNSPGPTPAAWDPEALYTKALRYAELMVKEDKSGWQHALMSALALELLARAALSNVSPALLADIGEKRWSHLFASLGYVPTEARYSPRSIALQDVGTRLGVIIPDFTKEMESFLTLHTGRRNAELHSGETAFDGIQSATWRPQFYRTAKVLLSSMGLSLEEFVGRNEAENAEKEIAAADDKAARAVEGEIQAHSKVWNAKPEQEREELTEAATIWATRQNGHRVECPACGSPALVQGETCAPAQVTATPDMIREAQECLPSRFECVACRLKIIGLSKLAVAGLADRFTRTREYGPAEYYALDDELADFEEDNNEP